MKEFISLLMVCVFLKACASHAPLRAEKLSQASGFQKEILRTETFDLLSYQKFEKSGKGTGKESLVIYIEGDGHAWASRSRLSTDPTPEKLTVLKLAAEDTSPNVAYLARPCQFVMSEVFGVSTSTPDSKRERNCRKQYWGSHRFAPEVIESMNEAVESLKQKSGASTLHLVGFSGGGAVAALLAAKRSDVATLRTIAGNLDHRALHDYHKVSPMPESLNPLDHAEKLKHIPQMHYVGKNDRIVPPEVAFSYRSALSSVHCVGINIVPDRKHHKGWVTYWKEAHKMMPTCQHPEAAQASWYKIVSYLSQ